MADLVLSHTQNQRCYGFSHHLPAALPDNEDAPPNNDDLSEVSPLICSEVGARCPATDVIRNDNVRFYQNRAIATRRRIIAWRFTPGPRRHRRAADPPAGMIAMVRLVP